MGLPRFDSLFGPPSFTAWPMKSGGLPQGEAGNAGWPGPPKPPVGHHSQVSKQVSWLLF